VYENYRIGGSLKTVIENIQKINALKERYRSPWPRMVFQFIPFASNVHQIDKAALLARLLCMSFDVRLNRFPEDVPMLIEEREKIREHAGYADRDEYLQQTKRHYFRRVCVQLWVGPRIRYDGRIAGCSCNNNYGFFPGNAFQNDFFDWMNSGLWYTLVKCSWAESLPGTKFPAFDAIATRPCNSTGTGSHLKRFLRDRKEWNRISHDRCTVSLEP